MKIYFTQNAKILTEEWGQNLANRFTKKMIGLLELLSIFPNMGVLEVEPKKNTKLSNNETSSHFLHHQSRQADRLGTSGFEEIETIK